MNGQFYMEGKPVRKPPRSTLLSAVMILAGVVVAALALGNWLQEWRAKQSPFDVVVGNDQPLLGFLPLIAHEEVAMMSDRAPTLHAFAASPAEPHDTNVEAVVDPSPTPTRLESLGSFSKNAGQTTPEPTWIPDRIRIPSINLDAPVVPVHLREIQVGKDTFEQWVAPDMFAAGWHATSATLGIPGNTVLNGHHNIYEEVFRDLHKVKEGSLIILYSGDQAFIYRVGLNILLEERFKPLEMRLANAQWILPSDDERITLITCWPYTSNTHRVVVVAIPATLGNEDRVE